MKSGSSTRDFDLMRAAEQRRRRRLIRNLETAIRDHISISKPQASVLWTPPQTRPTR